VLTDYTQLRLARRAAYDQTAFEAATTQPRKGQPPALLA
jgi:hypothetical protein